MQRCKRCVMPQAVPGIELDKDGLCIFCRNYSERKALGEEALKEIIHSVKNKGGKYDCVVPLSGGRDSSFVLYAAKVLYGLKVLAVNYDNEFRAEQAVVNMRHACEQLGVDFVSIRSKRSIAKKIVLNEMRSALAFGFSVKVTEVICVACGIGIRSVVYRMAQKYKAPLILWGESQAEATTEMQNEAAAKIRPPKWLRFSNISFYKAQYYRLLQKLEFYVPGNSIFSRKAPVLRGGKIKEIYLFDYISWDRNTIKKVITENLGWEKPRDSLSSWRIDCLLHPVVNYCYFKLLGCSKDCFGYCKMINSGKMNRDEALRQEEKMAEIFARDTKSIRDILKGRIGLSHKEIYKIESFGEN